MRAVWGRLSGPQKTVAQTVSVVVVMGALGFASVPLYDLFCRITGFGGTTDVSDGPDAEALDRTVTVLFDASRAADMPWEFRPLQREMTVRIGEVGLAFYEAVNPRPYPVAGTASYNVTPFAAGGHFAKIDCFCFEQQVLGPGERIEMPVTFYVDPSIVRDSEGRFVTHITLSYTFHRTDLPEAPVPPAAQAAIN